MPKQQHTIKLTGYTSAGKPATTQEGNQVVMFRNDNNSITVTQSREFEDTVVVTTAQSSYNLIKHPSIQNMYAGTLTAGIKAHFTKKKLVAKLIYWS